MEGEENNSEETIEGPEEGGTAEGQAPAAQAGAPAAETGEVRGDTEPKEAPKGEGPSHGPAKPRKVELGAPSGKDVIVTLHITNEQSLILLCSSLRGAPIVGPRTITPEEIGEGLRSAIERYRFELEKFRLEQKAKEDKNKKRLERKTAAASSAPRSGSGDSNAAPGAAAAERASDGGTAAKAGQPSLF